MRSRGYGRHWPRLRLLILGRDRWTCRWCEQPATTVDHIVAKAEGGSDEAANLVAACWKCQGTRANETMRNVNGWLK